MTDPDIQDLTVVENRTFPQYAPILESVPLTGYWWAGKPEGLRPTPIPVGCLPPRGKAHKFHQETLDALSELPKPQPDADEPVSGPLDFGVPCGS